MATGWTASSSGDFATSRSTSTSAGISSASARPGASSVRIPPRPRCAPPSRPRATPAEPDGSRGRAAHPPTPAEEVDEPGRDRHLQPDAEHPEGPRLGQHVTGEKGEVLPEEAGQEAEWQEDSGE